jgi:hypothetical protein
MPNIVFENGKAVIGLSPLVETDSIHIPMQIADKIKNNQLEIILPDGSVTFSVLAINGIFRDSDGGFTLSIVKQEELYNGRPLFELRIIDENGNQITEFDGNVEVSLPYELGPGENPNGIIVHHIGPDGVTMLKKNCRYENGKAIFTTNHFSSFVIAYNPVTFTDITVHLARSNIEQAGAKNLISGYSDKSFKPENYITRAEFIQLLYNALDLPYVENRYDRFPDVMEDSWFYQAVMAFIHTGLINGYTTGIMFEPDKQATRQEMLRVTANIAVKYNMQSHCETEIASLINTPGNHMTRAQATLLQLRVLRAVNEIM